MAGEARTSRSGHRSDRQKLHSGARMRLSSRRKNGAQEDVRVPLRSNNHAHHSPRPSGATRRDEHQPTLAATTTSPTPTARTQGLSRCTASVMRKERALRMPGFGPSAESQTRTFLTRCVQARAQVFAEGASPACRSMTCPAVSQSPHIAVGLFDPAHTPTSTIVRADECRCVG